MLRASLVSRFGSDGLQETLQKTLQETLQKRDAEIVRMMKENPEVTTSQIAEILGVSRQTIATRVKVLQTQGFVRRIDPDKGGRWEVVNKISMR